MSEPREDAGRDVPGDQEVSEMAKLLDELVTDQEASLKEAECLDAAPGLDRIESILEKAWRDADAAQGTGASSARATGPTSGSTSLESVATLRPSVGPRIPRLVLVIAVLAAAAALVVLVPRLVTGPAGPGPSGTTLGVGDLELVAPAEDAADWSVVEWNGPEGERFRVDIVDPATDGVLAGPHRTGETSWTPDLSGDLSAWPQRVLIRLEILAPGEPATERVTRIVLRPR